MLTLPAMPPGAFNGVAVEVPARVCRRWRRVRAFSDWLESLAQRRRAAIADAPIVASIAPNSGPAAGGTSVTITARNLGMESGASEALQPSSPDAIKIRFGSTPAASYIINSPTSVTATAPAGTGTVDVTVATA